MSILITSAGRTATRWLADVINAGSDAFTAEHEPMTQPGRTSMRLADVSRRRSRERYVEVSPPALHFAHRVFGFGGVVIRHPYEQALSQYNRMLYLKKPLKPWFPEFGRGLESVLRLVNAGWEVLRYADLVGCRPSAAEAIRALGVVDFEFPPPDRIPSPVNSLPRAFPAFGSLPKEHADRIRLEAVPFLDRFPDLERL